MTTKEVEEVCKSLKNNKAPGPGHVPPEPLKYATTELYDNKASPFNADKRSENTRRMKDHIYIEHT